MSKSTKNTKRFQKAAPQKKRDLVTKTDDPEYTQAVRLLGCRQVRCQMPNGALVTGRVRGRLGSQYTINVGDVLLVSTRDFEVDKVDIIGRYHPQEVKELQRQGLLPTRLRVKGDSESYSHVFTDDEGSDVD